jgi:hypothetical protein
VRRLLGILIGLLMLLAIGTAHRLVPDDERRMGSITTSGRLGERMDTGGFTITVEQVEVARRLTVPGLTSTRSLVTEDGVWVVVTATLVEGWEASSYTRTRLVARDGTSYLASARVPSDVQLTSGLLAEPGIPRRGMVVFEIPPDRLAGAVLRVVRGDVGGGRLAPEAVIELGIDESAARRLLDRASTPLELRPVDYG